MALAAADLVIEAATENPELEAEAVPRAGPDCPTRGNPGEQHFIDQHHQDRRSHQASRAGDRDALHEPGAADEAGGGDPRAGNFS